MITPLAPVNNAIVSLQTDLQKDFIRNRSFEKLRATDEELVDWLGLHQDPGDHSIPVPVFFLWTDDKPGRLNYIVQVFKQVPTEFSPSGMELVQEYRTQRTVLAVWNLEVSCQYFWRVFQDGSQPQDTLQSFFTEADAPRWLWISGCSNVRDCGGWMTSSGKRIKQGLLFRGTEFDRHHAIKPRGRIALKDDLHLRTDLDIRGATEILPGFKPPLDKDGIQWVNYPLAAYADIDKPEQRELYYRFFTALGNPDIYPAYCHCWGGADRTGTCCLLLGCVLGMSDSDLLLDYELTSCAIWGARKRNFVLFENFLKLLDKYGSAEDTIAAKGVGYLRSIGLEDTHFNALREIFL